MNVSNLTEEQAKAILDILAKRMGLDHCAIIDNRFCMLNENNLPFYAHLSPECQRLSCNNSYSKALEMIMSRRNKDKDTQLFIPGTTIFPAIKCPSLEELLIQLDIA